MQGVGALHAEAHSQAAALSTDVRHMVLAGLQGQLARPGCRHSCALRWRQTRLSAGRAGQLAAHLLGQLAPARLLAEALEAEDEHRGESAQGQALAGAHHAPVLLAAPLVVRVQLLLGCVLPEGLLHRGCSRDLQLQRQERVRCARHKLALRAHDLRAQTASSDEVQHGSQAWPACLQGGRASRLGMTLQPRRQMPALCQCTCNRL